MIVGELAQHGGRFCEIATHNGKFFGVLIRLSTAVFLIRPLAGAKSIPHVVAANEVLEVTPLPDSHL